MGYPLRVKMTEPEVQELLELHTEYGLRPRTPWGLVGQCLALACAEPLMPYAKTPDETARFYAEHGLETRKREVRVWAEFPRGDIDDWLDPEEFDLAYDWQWDSARTGETKEEIRRRYWRDEFPEESGWHEIAVHEEDGWCAVTIDHVMIAEAGQGLLPCPPVGRLRDLEASDRSRELLRALAAATRQVARALDDGAYGPDAEARMPPQCRWGEMSRADWVRIEEWNPWLNDMDEQDAVALAARLRAEAPDVPWRSEEGPWDTRPLTSRMYFDLLREGYRATGRKLDDGSQYRRGTFPDEDGRSWYLAFADGRDHGLLDLDPDDPEAFAGWLRGPGAAPDHAFEVLAGHGYSRCDLYPEVSGRGWRLRLSGPSGCHGGDLARMWAAMTDAGGAVVLDDADRVADVLDASDTVLVAPVIETDLYLHERNGRRYETVTHVYAPDDELAPSVAWEPVEVPERQL
ncbi:hypothetical protein QJ043_07110 [Olsenella sp. YH-ols2217]|uniref:SMI1/KNR4 family protein n=1 Tax=Kribbibacterium absianum TaxID=3044210 RepID=A0ABT6ZLC0_9ACTN|nr:MULTISPECIES: hypothetical protein [unclassified Olsenella]MDJ1121835.1 hypothetical protein [Olsenella sp. YH-ols2216]MDJ1129843.1 hypothetical protein [Olsenella sp. YH-ols2217]